MPLFNVSQPVNYSLQFVERSGDRLLKTKEITSFWIKNYGMFFVPIKDRVYM
jgi:hypothetical protein